MNKTFLEYFKGREDVYACQGKDYYYPIKKNFTEDDLQKHFDDLATFGLYVLNCDSKCNMFCIDVDIPKSELEDIALKEPNIKYNYLKSKLTRLLDVLTGIFNLADDEILLEDTGGRGFHIWLFLNEPAPGIDALKFYHLFKSFIDFDFEFFPKQPDLNSKRKYGNLIKLPLGTHQKYNSKSFFFQILNGQLDIKESFEENIKHLSNIRKVHIERLHEIIDKHKDKIDLNQIEDTDFNSYYDPDIRERKLFGRDLDYLLHRCGALNNLVKKAKNGIELSYKEAFHFTNILLSVENSHDFIVDTLKISFGRSYKTEITEKEIESIRLLRPSTCNRLIEHKICDNYCNPEIEKRNLDPLLKSSNPISFWLTPIKISSKINNDNILQEIANPENIINAYWKLKKYHRDEDVGYYDEFDFAFFERNLEINSKYLSRTLESEEYIPFIGYSKINVPKKTDIDGNMQFRQMTYSSIFDQIIIQSIFNIISQLLESEFQDYSYGYRCDFGNSSSDNIFHDWREYYPKFRNRVLSTLRHPNIKYYMCCDIKGFYDNIRHDILIAQLKKFIKNDYVIKLMERIIDLYKFDNVNKIGIPQGPAYARVLANLYLNDFDQDVLQYSSGFMRYVDDFFIFFEDENHANRGLDSIIKNLSDLGLILSDDEKKKPEIVESTDESIILSKLDSIQYGIFEEFKFIDYLDLEQVDKFYDEIDRQRVKINDHEETAK